MNDNTKCHVQFMSNIIIYVLNELPNTCTMSIGKMGTVC